jgi:nitroimidazol reductase NimA-like FMN-containing flavoprotein (pyridoxamine 5'-phosphate oxidase superfamily)
VVFRTAGGTKLLAADTEQRVAFEVDGFDPDRRAGWSVMVRGVATSVEDQEEIKRLNLLGVWPWADLIERTHWVRIRTYSMTGRQTVHPAR